MTISTFQAALKICELGGWQVTNLQLQKILYLASMMYMGKNGGEPLIKDHFEAWDYGPVVPALYHEVKMYGASPIRTGFFGVEPIDDECKEAKELVDACTYLLSKPPRTLVSMTHRPGGAWAKRYKPGDLNIVIPNSEIEQEYHDIESA